MKNFNKIIAIILVSTMIVSLPLNVSNAQGVPKENFDEILSDELDYEINEEGLTVETELSLEESEYSQENSFQLDNSTQEKDVEHVEVNLDLTLDEDEDSRLISIETDSDGNTVEKEYQVVIEEADEEKIIATFIDLSTGEEYTYNSTELSASFAPAIPIGIGIGKALLDSLFAAGLAVVIAGVTYVSYSEFSKKKKTKSHYMATRKSSGLFIGNGMSRTKAVSHLKSGKDTWSTSKSNAQSIAKSASPKGKAVGAEIDKNGKGKHYHYHPVKSVKQGKSVRMASHAFYGAPRK
ncbi:SAR2788 family putative toxin [Cytobacillus sp. FSL K6-0265]|uniref:SAR2788 family putative toxin n=1 Tax=Cytobacillus sp. FSL K6-0265 TaxID=2921448 RepID=UPI0030FAAE89